MDYSKFFIEKTSEGYMVRDIVSDDYLCDSKGDNTFELWAYAHDVLLTHVESLRQTTLKRLRTQSAIEMLEDAEVMKEFDDCVWIKVDIYQWETFNNAGEE